MASVVYVVTDHTSAVIYAGTDPTDALIYGRPTTPSGHNILTTFLDGRPWDGTPTMHLYADYFILSGAWDDRYQRCATCGRMVGWDGHPYFHHYPFPV